MKYKAVIFDLYGTLVSSFSVRLHEAVLKEMARVVDAPPEEFIRLWFDSYEWRAIGKIASPEDNIKYILEKLNIEVDEAKVKEAAEIRYEFTRKNLEPWPDAVEVLARLKSLGYKLALISDCSAETPMMWESSVIASLMDVSLFSCVVGVKKPDPRIYLQATERLGVRPEECLYIGDGSSQELSGAARVGMHPVMIRVSEEIRDAHRIDEDKWDGPRISKLSEVLALVGEENKTEQGENR